MLAVYVLSGLLLSAGAQAQPQSESRTMEFDQCLPLIRQTVTQLGVAPINIVETQDIRIVRFPTSDGGVLVSCSRLDRKVVITRR